MIVGKALRLGDHVNTDELHPSRFFSLDDATVRSGFLKAVAGRTVAQPEPGRETTGRSSDGQIVIAGVSFGVGSSRETGARVFVLNGIRAIVAVSFARIFYRNVMNLGLPALVCPGLSHIAPSDGDRVEVDLERGRVRFGAVELITEPLDPYFRALVDAGGLTGFLGLGRTTPRPAERPE
jgi:3-isopropylmalate/(R)-2-methylmalate dehydratase small subunit